MSKKRKIPKIDSFRFEPGRRLARKYEIVSKIGAGWESEVYLIRELTTGIERAAKFFFPHRNPNNRALKFYAKKLHKLRHCPILIQYHTQESFFYYGALITFLVSEYVGGEMLEDYIRRQPGRRLHYFQALHLLYAMAVGVEKIHQVREYHGDLHTENIIVQGSGLGFDLKVIDLYHYAAPRPENIHDDVLFMIRIFFEAMGGHKIYPQLPPEVRSICCGLRRATIVERFKNAGQLRRHLETMRWKVPK